MAKILRRLLITALILLALAGAGGVAVVRTQHLSFDSVQHPIAGFNRGDLLILKSAGPTAKSVVIKSIPKAGYGLDAMRIPLGLVAIVYLPAILLVVYELRRLNKHYAYQSYDVAAHEEVWTGGEYNRIIN